VRTLVFLATAMLIWIAGVAPSSAQAPNRPIERPVDPIRDSFVQPTEEILRLDKKLREYASSGFSGAVLVFDHGIIALHKAYGLSNRSDAESLTTATPFPIGSLTRLLTAGTILRLQMQGRLDTGDPASGILPDIEGNTATKSIHDLLSGDDAGYRVLARVIETVSGETFEDAAKKILFDPAKMRESWFMDPDRPDPVQAARGHTGTDPGLRRIANLPAFGVLVSAQRGSLKRRAGSLTEVAPPIPTQGASGIASTTGDLFEWSLAVTGESVFSPDARTQLMNPIDNTVSYGWRFERTGRGTPRMSATADMTGFQAGLWIYPADQLTIVILANNDMGWRDIIRRTIETNRIGRNYTFMILIGGMVVLFVVLQGAMRRRVTEPRRRMLRFSVRDTNRPPR
jgi:CubicO group peptidase (beta-lactamase class C family)